MSLLNTNDYNQIVTTVIFLYLSIFSITKCKIQVSPHGLVGNFTLSRMIVLTGDEVQVVYKVGTDTTPVYASASFYYAGFNGFRIWVIVMNEKIIPHELTSFKLFNYF